MRTILGAGILPDCEHPTLARDVVVAERERWFEYPLGRDDCFAGPL